MEKKSASKSAFINPRTLMAFALCVIGLLIGLLAYPAYPSASLLAQKPRAQITQQWQPHWQVVADSHHDVSPPLRELALLPLPPSRGGGEDRENWGIPINHTGTDRPDPVVQNEFLNGPITNIPGPIFNFDGIPNSPTLCIDNCGAPDPNGYPGLTQYVQIVNQAYQVFDKMGNSVFGPAPIQSIWANFGGDGACENHGHGDPIVLYDKLADRWLISQFARASAEDSFPTYECIAISTTRDATGSYYRYEFDLRMPAPGGNNYDYPKLATWPDAYYMADNVNSSTGRLGPVPFAFERTKMLCGQPARVISPGPMGTPASTEDLFMPSDFDGTVLPPPGAPNSFVEFPNFNGNNAGTYRTWHYYVDFDHPMNSHFTQVPSPTAAPYSCLCGCAAGAHFPCVPQVGVDSQFYLNPIGDRLMFRLAYRNFGTPLTPDESTVGNFSVNGGTDAPRAAPRWFELKNVTNGLETINQEGTFAPEEGGVWRWMGSVAMDHSGDLAVGYSASGYDIHPQIRYAGRLSSDPVGTLAQGEAHLYDGNGSQEILFGRWGDYSAITVDPVDDTTMWYTQEYHASGSAPGDWRTRFGKFRINAGQKLVNVSAKSELTHSNTGPFAIDLPLYGGAPGSGRGVECRSAYFGAYTIIFNFTNSLIAPGTATSTCGTPTAAIINPHDNHQVLVSLSAGGCNAQYITIHLNNVQDGTYTISPAVTFGLLLGDTDGNGVVNATDVPQVSVPPMAACPPNFRQDVNVDGSINSPDVAVVQSLIGKSLPSLPP